VEWTRPRDFGSGLFQFVSDRRRTMIAVDICHQNVVGLGETIEGCLQLRRYK